MSTSEDVVRKAYNEHDLDHNGVLSIDEAESAYRALGAHAKALDFEQHFNKLAKDGTISYEDFKTFAKGF